MHLFLTSSPSGCPYEPGPPVLDERNGFAKKLREVWPAQPIRCLLLASSPDDPARNDQMRDAFATCFRQAGLPVAEMSVCDRRNAGQFPELLAGSGFVMLCGGHVPTQNRFFAELRAAEALQTFGGILMGVSAGTMNAAALVYAQPEEPGEAIDPGFARWLPGLGLTKINVLPHFQVTRHWTLDDLRLVEDIALPDSFSHPMLALPDGSYIYSADGRETLCGEAWRIADGRIEKICKDGGQLEL